MNARKQRLTETQWRDYQAMVEAEPDNANAERCPFCLTRHRDHGISHPFCDLVVRAKLYFGVD